MSYRYFLLGAAALALTACGSDKAAPKAEEVPAPAAEAVAPNDTDTTSEPARKALSLADVLDMQDDAAKARYEYRHPKETLELIGVKPGMTVVEVLPGGGWYSKILLPYLGDEGTLIGADDSVDMWGKFGGFANPEFLEKRKTWTKTWADGALAWRGGTQAEIKAFAFGSMPSDLKGTADAVIAVRAMHHVNRWDGVYWDEVLADTKAILKDGGVVGIVQHRSPESHSDSAASGDNGYIKQSLVISKFEEAGFELVGQPSEINANPKDQPKAEEQVWRLPPTLATSRKDPELKAEMTAIGETDRMTLVFRKK